MKRIIALVVLTTVFIAVLALLPAAQRINESLAPAALAQSSEIQDEPAIWFQGKTCSQATLKGPYGVLMHGNVLGWPGFPMGPIAAIAIINFDGAGNYTSYSNTAGLNGFFFNQPNFSGTYVVNSDCTGTVLSPLGIFQIVIADDGKEYRVLWGPGSGQVISGLVKRIAPEPRDDRAFERVKTFYCNPGVVAGSYAITWHGSIINPQPPPSPLTGLSLFTHQDDATVIGKGTMDLNGIKQPFETVLKTTVNSNCTFSASSDAGDRFVGVFVNGGDEYFVLALPAAGVPNLPGQGKVMYGVAKRTHQSER
jgi:hypothetical protein